VVADTNSARILVFATGELVAEKEVVGEKTRKTSQGGWSQARFQRHISNFHQQHAKEVVDALDRIVREEGITQILTAGDEVILPLLRAELPKHLADKVVDHLKLDVRAPVDEVLKATMDALSRENDRTDREKVEAAINGYRAGTLGVVGPEDTLDALVKGQVDELLLTADMGTLQNVSAEVVSAATANDSTLLEPAVDTAAGGEAAEADPQVVRLADELVKRAKGTSARVTFIEDASLLKDYGGVAALLRFRI
jgi:peptide chain release factor subunit 1